MNSCGNSICETIRRIYNQNDCDGVRHNVHYLLDSWECYINLSKRLEKTEIKYSKKKMKDDVHCEYFKLKIKQLKREVKKSFKYVQTAEKQWTKEWLLTI